MMRYLLFFIFLFSAISCRQKKKIALPDPGIFYTCSMHPQIMQNKPGKCPVCSMDLIPVKKTEAGDPHALMLSDQQIQLGNIHVDTIGKGIIGSENVLTASLTVDETKSTTVNARVSGRIDKLYFKSEGDYISKGQKLYDLYSEELNNAKQEYILALEKQATLDNSIIDFKQLVQSAKNKLLLWGMREVQIKELSTTRKASLLTSFYSSESGYVTTLESHQGDYVSAGTTVIRLNDLSDLWAEAQVYASQLSQIDRSAIATVQLPDLEKEINGRIQFVNPEINPDTRINLLRVAIQNPTNQLKPGMLAYVILKNRQHSSLTLPVNAVIKNATSNVVWIETGKNTFKSVMVDTGIETGGRIEIKNGLKPGDVVVTSGAYLINSEYVFKKGADPMAGMQM